MTVISLSSNPQGGLPNALLNGLSPRCGVLRMVCANRVNCLQRNWLRSNKSWRACPMRPIDGGTDRALLGPDEVRSGNNIYYTDANGDFLIEGHVIDTRTGRDLTDAR